MHLDRLQSSPQAVPQTVRLIRESRGLKVKDLADIVKRTPGFVSKVELGQTGLSGERLNEFAEALNVRPSLLLRTIAIEPEEGVHFRSQSRTPAWIEKKVVSDANWTAFVLNELLEKVDADFPLALPSFDVDSLDGSAAEAAQLLRKTWRLVGPVDDIVHLLESAGIFVMELDPSVTTVDAVTVRTRGMATAVIFLSESTPVERKRHTLAHELGHLCLDSKSQLNSFDAIEKRADEFAGEFLAPYSDLSDELRGITPSSLERLSSLRVTWGVSVASMIRRAYLHGDLTQSQYQYWFRVLNARKLLRATLPSAYAIEPRAARDLVRATQADGLSIANIADLTDSSPADLERFFGDQWPAPRTSPRLKIVPS